MMKYCFLGLLFCCVHFSIAQKRINITGDFWLETGLTSATKMADELKTKSLASRTANIYYLYQMRLDQNGFFSFRPGVGIGSDGYVFEDSKTNLFVANDQVRLGFDAINNTQKSKLSATYLDFPLEFHLKTKDLRFALGGKIGYLIASHTKTRYENPLGEEYILKQKGDFRLQKLRYGLTARLGYEVVNGFFYYSFNQLFQDGKTNFDNPTPIVFGISVVIF